MGGGPLASWKTGYTALALLVFNSILFFLLFNGLAGLYLKKYDTVTSYDQQIVADAGRDALEKTYPGKTWTEILALLKETWTRRFIYEPFVQFREPPFEGQFIHVTEAGFRTSGTPQPWPPDKGALNLFMLGGSTTFGYGVSDNETISAYLEGLLAKNTSKPLHVYNFGQGFYYSSQELIFFQRLLVQGWRPDGAIFLDGLNDFFHEQDRPFFTDRLRVSMLGAESADGLGQFISGVSVVKLANKVMRRLSPPTTDGSGKKPETRAQQVIDRYLANQRLIQAMGGAFGVPTFFAWQPVPTYHHEPQQQLLKGVPREHALSGLGYELFAQRLQTAPLGNHFIWCADVQVGIEGVLYVDRVHYNAQMSSLIAKCLMDRLLQQKALP